MGQRFAVKAANISQADQLLTERWQRLHLTTVQRRPATWRAHPNQATANCHRTKRTGNEYPLIGIMQVILSS